MKSIQKYLPVFLNMIIVASLCFASQNNVLAQSQIPVGDKAVSPPLSPDLTWKSLGNVQKSAHVYGRTLTLNGDAFESVEDFQNKNPESIFQYYSSENLQTLGWTFTGGAGVELTYQHVSGTYLTVQVAKCINFETNFCVNVWQSTEISSSSFSAIVAAAVAFGKTTPLNGATIPLPTTTYQLLQWGDAAIDASDRYEYCIDESNNSTCDGNNWITRNSLYSGNGEFTVLSGHTYYWQVRARDAGTIANSGTWWSFNVATALGFPIVKSILRANPSPTHASSVSFTVTFDQGVTGVDTSDFSLATTGISDAFISGVTGSSGSNTYTVTVSTGIGSGTVKLNLIDNDSIKNSQSTPIGGAGTGNGNYSGETYSIDRTFKIIYGNAGADGVTLSYMEDGMFKTTTSLADGSYIIAVFSGWTGTVTPFKIASTFYLFSPRNRSYVNLSANQAAQDYTVTQVTLYRSLLPLIFR